MKIKLSEKEIELIICVLEASLDSAMPCRYAESSDGELFAMETQRKKAELIERMKKLRFEMKLLENQVRILWKHIDRKDRK